jgi:hypothetical protein
MILVYFQITREKLIFRRIKCRIVFISAFESSRLEADAEFLRQVSFFPKPLSDQALAAILDNHI